MIRGWDPLRSLERVRRRRRLLGVGRCDRMTDEQLLAWVIREFDATVLPEQLAFEVREAA